MNMRYLYLLIPIIVIGADRITKWYATTLWVEEYVVNKFVSLQLCFNRGISWGMLNYNYLWSHFLVMTLIILVTISLGIYAYRRAYQGYSVSGELLVLSGSVSNIVDRFTHAGVIDFIIVHKGGLAWPVFNIADAAIVTGVGCMFFSLLSNYREHYS